MRVRENHQTNIEICKVVQLQRPPGETLSDGSVKFPSKTRISVSVPSQSLAVLPYFYSLSVGEGVLISKMNILVGKKTCLLSVPQVFNNKLTFNNKLRAERDFSVFLWQGSSSVVCIFFLHQCVFLLMRREQKRIVKRFAFRSQYK